MTLRLISMKRLALLLVSAVLLLAACEDAPSNSASPSSNPSGPTAAGELDGDWLLVAGQFDGGDIPLGDDYDITMTIAGNQLGGIAACNHYGGEFSTDGDDITIGSVVMTEMACLDEQRMAAESAYLAALAQVSDFSLEGDKLFFSGEGVMLQFDAAPPPETSSLIGPNWVLDTLIDGDTASSVAGMPATLLFGEDNTFSGSTGCRSFSGDFTLDGDAVAVSNMVTSSEPCTPENGEQDGHVLAVIESGFRVQIDGNRLTITNDDGLGLSLVAGA